MQKVRKDAVEKKINSQLEANVGRESSSLVWFQREEKNASTNRYWLANKSLSYDVLGRRRPNRWIRPHAREWKKRCRWIIWRSGRFISRRGKELHASARLITLQTKEKIRLRHSTTEGGMIFSMFSFLLERPGLYMCNPADRLIDSFLGESPSNGGS
jgi:hypothetical protein